MRDLYTGGTIHPYYLLHAEGEAALLLDIPYMLRTSPKRNNLGGSLMYCSLLNVIQYLSRPVSSQILIQHVSHE